MVDSINNISAIAQNKAAAQSGKARVLSAIQSASKKTGVDFSYLLTKAQQESSLNPTAKAAGSSATGLFQFIDQTWLKSIKENGAEFGLEEYADKVKIGSDGIARVVSYADKKEILALRNDPEISATMAAKLAQDNKETLQAKVGGEIGGTEMYLAHFLGSGGASTFLNAKKTNPNIAAADLLPTAASANKSVFYDKSTGRAKTVGEIYAKFASKFEGVAENVKIQVASLQKDTSSSASVDSSDQTSTFSRDGVITSGSSMTFANGISIGAKTDSAFATMMLAQMDMESFGIDTKDYALSSARTDKERQKSILEALAAVS